VFKILSLDGGGIRGTFPAAFLAKIQENLDLPLVRYFDLIVGTSTGGLIAVALGMGIAPKDIRDLYELEGPPIFTRQDPQLSAITRRFIQALLSRVSPNLDAEWLFQSKYGTAPLKAALVKRLNERLLGEAQCRLVIPSVDLAAGKVIVFKTPHRPNFIRDRHFRAVDVILATTAAPSYFPSASIEKGSLYCDGGIWANNPALVGYVEAMEISDECKRPETDPYFSHETINLLSIGTGRAAYFVSPNVDQSGLKWWGPRLLNISGETQSEGIHGQMEYLLGDRYSRINFDIPDGDWGLDAVGNIGALLHLGSQYATEHFPNLRARFFAQEALNYRPFEI
jgi:uncharacterized protein